MLHLRADWAGIQDGYRQAHGQECHELGECCDCCLDFGAHEASTILADEPVLLIPASDPCAPDLVRRYAQLAWAKGSDPDFVRRILKWADQMESYAHEHFLGQQQAPAAPELLPDPA